MANVTFNFKPNRFHKFNKIHGYDLSVDQGAPVRVTPIFPAALTLAPGPHTFRAALPYMLDRPGAAAVQIDIKPDTNYAIDYTFPALSSIGVLEIMERPADALWMSNKAAKKVKTPSRLSVKRLSGLLMILLSCLVAITLFCSPFILAAYDIFSASSSATTQRTITELYETYESSSISITATDVKIEPTTGGKVFVGVRFVIKNTSTSTIFFDVRDIQAYVDDLATSGYDVESFNEGGESLGTETISIAPGKRIAGYYCVKASPSSEKVEIQVPTTSYGTKPVAFVFDLTDATDNAAMAKAA